MAEEVEIAYLEGHFVGPEAVIEVVQEGKIDHQKGQHGGTHQDITTVGVVLKCFSGGVEYFTHSGRDLGWNRRA